jgi:hypothetical protein
MLLLEKYLLIEKSESSSFELDSSLLDIELLAL